MTTISHAPRTQTVEPNIPIPRAMDSSRQPRAFSELDLTATSTAVNIAKLFVDYTLREWGHTDLINDAQQIAAELVSDAVVNTGIPEPGPRWTELDKLALLRVRVVLLKQAVIIEIADEYDQPPMPSEALQMRCIQWNSYPTSAGRVVWAELEILQYELTDHGLPKRKRAAIPEPVDPPRGVTDHELLRRVVEGIKRL